MLEIDFTDGKSIVMQKIMRLIQQSPDKMSEFRRAQIEIFNPAQRFLHHYLRSVSNDASSNPVEIVHLTKLKSDLSGIPLRSELFECA